MSKFEAILCILCKSTTAQVFLSLEAFGFTTVYNSRGKRYAYRPGKTDTSPLVVCHADTVVDGGNGPHAYSSKGSVVTSIALDDRLGIACMIEAVDSGKPMADCAMLVCDDEEIGRSTASIFDTMSRPNWMVELDRRGADVVAYQYDSTLLRSLLSSVGFIVGTGSFSDISNLDHLGVIGFNMGVGYHAEHTKGCHANLNDTYAQLARLDAFLAKFADVRLEYNEDDQYQTDYRSYPTTGSYKPTWKPSKPSTPYYPDMTDEEVELFEQDAFADEEELFAENNGLTYEDVLYDDDEYDTTSIDRDEKWRF